MVYSSPNPTAEMGGLRAVSRDHHRDSPNQQERVVTPELGGDAAGNEDHDTDGKHKGD